MQNERIDRVYAVVRLSIPAILAEITSVIMQYIDAAMVGSLGAEGTASIGLVSTSTWLAGGLCMGAATGFSVQVAHRIGAGESEKARDILRQSLIVCLLIGIMLSAIGISISGALPVWLGGNPAIVKDASKYFFIYAATLPAIQFRYLAGSMLQCSGDMRTPSVLNASMCILDVLFNRFFIFPSETMIISGHCIKIPGAGLGVEGAALGTAFAEVIVCILMLWAVCIHSKQLNICHKGKWKLEKSCLEKAVKIALPMTFEHTVMCGAQVMSTYIIAPIGTTAVAANSLAVTAESFCYMPGYGIGTAATTLVGQSVGAKKEKLARQYARVSIALGIAIMSISGIVMYIFAPQIFAMLTPDSEVQQLGVLVLRVEAFAEPMYAASIVVAGALRGVGDTLIPSILNLVSMWGVRIVIAFFLAPVLGLLGVWIAMCIELIVRGILFLILFKCKKFIANV